MSKLINLVGKRFGRLLVLERAPNRLSGGIPHTKWKTLCDCGQITISDAESMRDGRSNSCGCLMRELSGKRQFKHGMADTSEGSAFVNAKRRAQKLGIPFNLTREDIVTPEFCPLLGIKLESRQSRKELKGLRPNSPSLDKIRPELGYIKGNVWVISHKANTIKSNASLGELQKIVKGLKKKYAETV